MFKKYIQLISFLFVVSVCVINDLNKTEEKFPVLNFEDWLSTDMSRRERFLKQMGDALHDFGFFAMTHHGIESDEISKVYHEADLFFSQPPFEKKLYEGVIRNRGYKGFSPNRLDKIADLQEYWHVGNEDKANLWPEGLPLFKPVLYSLYQKGEGIAESLLEACALVIGERSSYFAEKMQEKESVLRVIHYLKPQEEQGEQTTWKAAHKDPNLLTLIIGISSEGLQIERPKGRWLSVPLMKEAIVVSASDMLERLSNGYFKSTLHRVISQQRTSRYAFPFFAHLDRNASLEASEKVIEKTGGTALYRNKETVGETLKDKSWF